MSGEPKRLRAKRITATKIDLACGDNKKEGYFGIDRAPTDAADAVLDLTVTPWPIESDSVEDLNCSHFFEHLTGMQRIVFMDECWRILKASAQMVIIVPYWSSMRSIQDPTHQWPPVCEASFLYFNKKWREDNKLTHYPIKSDFDFCYGYSLDNDLLIRNQEFQQFAMRHYIQAANDLHVTLTKRSM